MMMPGQLAEYHRVDLSITGFELVLLIAGGVLTLALAGFFAIMVWRTRPSGSKPDGDNEHP